MKKNTAPRRASRAPAQPTTTPPPAPRLPLANRPDPDRSGLPIVDCEDPCVVEPELLFRPQLRFVPE
jgi:hypothetical protein